MVSLIGHIQLQPLASLPKAPVTLVSYVLVFRFPPKNVDKVTASYHIYGAVTIYAYISESVSEKLNI